MCGGGTAFGTGRCGTGLSRSVDLERYQDHDGEESRDGCHPLLSRSQPRPCACSSADDTESRHPTAVVESTQFAPPPAPITDLVPTAEQLTALYNATVNYSIREEDRARLLDGPSDENLRIARAWGAQPSPQQIQFTTVEPVGPEESTRLVRAASVAWNLTRWDQSPSCVLTTNGSYPAPTSAMC